MPASRYRPETRLVQAGTLRSEFGETSEALFLTQGYVYESSAQAERRFKNEEPGSPRRPRQADRRHTRPVHQARRRACSTR